MTTPREQTLTQARLIALATALGILGLGAVTVALAVLGRVPDPESGTPALWPEHLSLIWITSFLQWCALTLLWLVLPRRRRRSASDPACVPRNSRRATVRSRLLLLVIGVATLARIAVLVTHEPVLSDDIHRYIFDGRTVGAGSSPYLVAPIEYTDPALRTRAEAWAGQSTVAALVNHPELHTIYLPLSQWIFAAATLGAGDDPPSPSALARRLRALFVLLELAALLLLARALVATGRHPLWLALYAWHPLPLTEIAGSGHQDAIGLPLLVGALLLFTLSPRRIIAWTLALAAAVLVKPVVLPVTALLLRGREWRAWLLAAAVGAALVTVVTVPLVLLGGGAGESIRNLAATATRFSLKWAHFGGLHDWILATIESVPRLRDWSNDAQEQTARTICLAILAGAIAIIFAHGRDAWRDASCIFLAMVLLTPTAHPWYLLWSLVLLPIARLRAVWIASLTLPWGYAAYLSAGSRGWSDTSGADGPSWLPIIAHLPIYAALIIDVIRPSRDGHERAREA